MKLFGVVVFAVVGFVGVGVAQEPGLPPETMAPAALARVSAGVMAGQKVSGANPAYPADAKAARVSGVVVLRVVIGKDGAVERETVISGPGMLQESAMEAVKTWVYKPYLLNGVATEVDTTITVNYSLGDGGAAGGGEMSREAEAQGAASTLPTGAVRVSGGVMAGAITSKVQPVYPQDAKAAHVSGAVVMRALIGPDGRVEKLQVMSGPEMLRQSALDAVRQWVYRPYLLQGNATEVDTTVTVIYSFGE